jgi:GxxExxY protein
VTADDVAKDIVDAAIKVHRALGPGLLESAYQACLAHEDVSAVLNAKWLCLCSLKEY